MRRFLKALVLLLILVLISGPSPLLAEIATETSVQVPTAISYPLKVEIGLYVLNITRLDMKDCDFNADFYIWYKLDPLASGVWSPETIEFANGTIESASPLQTDTPTDGKLYWSQRIKGKFQGNFNLHRYPFDSQTLSIIIEDREAPEDQVMFVPSIGAPPNFMEWIDPKLQVPDWKIANANLVIATHHYHSDFGLENGRKDSKKANYSRFEFSLNIDRLFIPHMIKFLIPLLVIAGMAYLVFFIHASEFESQCAICVTSLLSAVALHISQSDALPAVGYLVVADKVFILFYIIIFSALVQTVIANNYQSAGNLEAASRLDQTFRYAYILGLIIGGFVIAGTI